MKTIEGWPHGNGMDQNKVVFDHNRVHILFFLFFEEIESTFMWFGSKPRSSSKSFSFPSPIQQGQH